MASEDLLPPGVHIKIHLIRRQQQYPLPKYLSFSSQEIRFYAFIIGVWRLSHFLGYKVSPQGLEVDQVLGTDQIQKLIFLRKILFSVLIWNRQTFSK